MTRRRQLRRQGALLVAAAALSILNALAFAVPAIAAGTGAERLIGWLMLPVLVGIGFVLAAIGRDLIMRATHITPSGPDDVARTRAEVPNYALPGCPGICGSSYLSVGS